jgi:hypothetical protein
MIKRVIAPALSAALLLPFSGGAQEASITANAGRSSNYFYSGIPQKTSSASAGMDATVAGLFVGAWGADVGTETKSTSTPVTASRSER